MNTPSVGMPLFAITFSQSSIRTNVLKTKKAGVLRLPASTISSKTNTNQ